MDQSYHSLMNQTSVRYRPVGTALPPFVLGIFPPQLRPDAGIVLAPEVRQVLGHLDRPHARGEDMHAEENPALSNARCLCYIEEFLDTQRDERRALRFIRHSRCSSIAERHSLGCV